jgi:DNA-binding NarL/FixJ family response regulator
MKYMKEINIIIVDDHKLIREMWKEMFSRNPNLKVIGESGMMQEAIELIKQKRPDLVLLDINLAGDSGFDAMPLIKKYAPGTQVIVVSMHNQPAYAKKMLRMGAKGYITKNSSSQEIIQAIKTVMDGGKYICDEIKDALTLQVISDEPEEPSVKDLTLREIEIIKLIKEGLASKEIADRLNISVRTVEVHRYNILKKLKLKARQPSSSLSSFLTFKKIPYYLSPH